MQALTPNAFPAQSGDCIAYYGLIEPGAIAAHMGAAIFFGALGDISRMRAALQLLVSTEPLLSQRFVPGPSGLAWRPAEASAGAAVLPVVPTVDPEADAAAFIAGEFDPCAGAQVRGVLLRSQDRDALALQVSHIATDARGVVEMLYRLAAIHRDLGGECGWRPPSRSDDAGLEPSTGAEIGLAHKVSAMVSYAAGFDTPNEWPHLKDSGLRGCNAYFFGALGPLGLRSVRERSAQVGAAVDDALLTAYHRALCRLLDVPAGASTPVNMAVDLRGHLPAGVECGLTPCTAYWTAAVSPVADESFDGTLSRVLEWAAARRSGATGCGTDGMEEILERMMHGSGAMRIAGTKMGDMYRRLSHEPHVRRVLPILMTVGGIDDRRLDFGGPAKVDRARWYPPIAFGPCCMGAQAFRGRLELCMAADPAHTDPTFARQLVDATVEELEAWIDSDA